MESWNDKQIELYIDRNKHRQEQKQKRKNDRELQKNMKYM